jgi:hypothetical protein
MWHKIRDAARTYWIIVVILLGIGGYMLHDQFKHHTYYTLSYDNAVWRQSEVEPGHDTICEFIELAPPNFTRWTLAVDTYRGSGSKAYLLEHREIGDAYLNSAPQKIYSFLHPGTPSVRLRSCDYSL